MQLKVLLLSICAIALTGCGFTPLYATSENSGSQGLRDFTVVSLTASDRMRPTLERALSVRSAGANSAAPFSLSLEVEEAAGPLAVQIDASVTRYNYRVRGKYSVVDRVTGDRLRGTVNAVASFNVVRSQYSTLFAEKAAREKAATSLIEKLERQILLGLDEKRRAKAKRAQGAAPKIDLDTADDSEDAADDEPEPIDTRSGIETDPDIGTIMGEGENR